MTNTMNTPIEALEIAYPFRIRQYELRPGSGGGGLHPGGDGVVRSYEFLAPATITLISERRRFAPWGLQGGSSAETGTNRIRRAGGGAELLPGKFSMRVNPGDVLENREPRWRRVGRRELDSGRCGPGRRLCSLQDSLLVIEKPALAFQPTGIAGSEPLEPSTR